MAFPTPADVRKLLKGFNIDTKSTLVLAGNLQSGVATVTGIDTTSLEPSFYVSGANIPALTKVLSVDVVDPANGQITLDSQATGTASGVSLTFTYYDVLTDDWFNDCLNNEVQPYVEAKCRQKFDQIETVTEYYDGTGSSILVLRRRPVVSLVSLSYTNVDSNLYYLTPTAMVLIPDDGVLKAKANFNESTYTPIFWKGQRNLRVEYQVGWATCPADVAQAIKYMMAESGLGQIADQTGGGGLSLQAFSREYGDRGRYTNIRNMFAAKAYGLLRKYMTGTI